VWAPANSTLLTCCILLSPSTLESIPAGPQVLFLEDFKTLNRAIWALELGDGSDTPSGPGWGNGELQCYTDAPENIAVIPNPDWPVDGVLRIRSFFSGAPKPCVGRAGPVAPKLWTSARLTTRGTRTFSPVGTGAGCGPITLEARIKMPGRQGHWGGFWALGANGIWPAAGEIDIAEHANNDPYYFATTHYQHPAGHHEQNPREPVNKLHVANPTGWNVYRVDWSCDSISWFLNGELKQRLTKAQNPSWPFNGPFYLILNMAVGGNLPGPNADPAGATMLIDWVKVTGPAVPAG